jgi:MrcB-like, N-terminal domain/Domain of unknown function (DUF3883)
MRAELQKVITLQKEYSATSTDAMVERGLLIRHALRDELRHLGPRLRRAMGSAGDDADAEGRDHTGQRSRIPWVRWHSKIRSPSATQGWYVVYLFHPGGSGVSLCLSHGSTVIEGGDYKNRSAAEAAKLVEWASDRLKEEFASDGALRKAVDLGTFPLAVGYQRTTVFSKFYPDGQIPGDSALQADLVRFVRALAKLYRALDEGRQPGSDSPEVRELRQAVEEATGSAKRRQRAKGQGRARNLSPEARKAIENCAMARACEWLKSNGFDFIDVSARDCCDFRARRDGEDWVIEVKGTTGGPGSVLLTPNEVNLHRSSHPRNVLLVVHSIELLDSGTRASGGELLELCPWGLEEKRLKPMGYEYRLS